MARTFAILFVVAGTAAIVLGGVLLLVFAQYSGALAGLGIAAITAALVPLAFAAPPARRRTLLVYGVAAAATVGAWAVARSGPSGRHAPPGPASEAPPSPMVSGEALAAGLAAARAAVARLEQIEDYTFVVAKRERAKSLVGRMHLTDAEVFVKIRHTPSSVYARFLRPDAKAGTEAVYVEGRNDGKMVAHSTLPGLKMLGTLRLEPTDWRAMIDERYPITHAGIKNLALALTALADAHAEALEGCTVTWIAERTVGGRPCFGVEIRNDDPEGGLDLALAIFLFDAAWRLPVRMQRWLYLEPGGEPTLVEDYTVTELRLDVGLDDTDFDPDNPAYGY